MVNSKELKAWVKDARLKLLAHACTLHKVDKNDAAVSGLNRAYDNMVRETIAAITAAY